MAILSRLPRLLIPGLALGLVCCATTGVGQSAPPSTGVQQTIAQPLAVFTPTTAAQSPATQPPAIAAPTDVPPRMGIAGLADASVAEGNAARGRDFAFDNCRPCHVVAPSQTSVTRFSNAPDFRSIANMPATTPFSLIVWLTNPHPTMPSLVLSPQEAADVIAYIQSLRNRS